MKAADLANKYVTIEGVALPADDGVLTVKAAVKSDVAGNVVTSPVEKTDTVTIDTTASITMTIKDGVATDTDNSDGYINNADAKIKTIAGTVSDVEKGQTVTVTLTGQGGTTKTVEAEVGTEGKWETTAIDFNGLSEGTITAVAKVMDKAGNSAESTADSTIKDTVIPVPTIKLTEDTAGASETDNISSKGELTIVVDSTENHTTKSTIESVKYVKEDGTEGEITGGDTTNGTGYVLPTDTKYKSITVTSVDEAGNKNTATLENVGIDSHAPDIAVKSVKANIDLVNGGSVFTVEGEKDTIGYYENIKAGVIIGTFDVTDDLDVNDNTEYNSGVWKYEWDNSATAKGTDEQRGFYDIDSAGNISLTVAGAASYMNDFETGLNEVTLTLKAIDNAGNSSTRDITFKVGDTLSLSRLQDTLSNKFGVTEEYGLKDDSANALKTSENSEKIWIGHKENGDKYNLAYDGNIDDLNNTATGSGRYRPYLFTHGGSDFVSFDTMAAKSGIFTGTGNDTVSSSGDLWGSSVFGYPVIMTEEGDDNVVIGKYTLGSDGSVTFKDGKVGTSAILTGSGSDNVTINILEDEGIIDLGRRDPVFENSLTVYNNYKAEGLGTDFGGDLATDKNSLVVNDTIKDGYVYGGIGSDGISVANNVEGSKIDLGDGENVVFIGKNMSGGDIKFGKDNDEVTIAGEMSGGSIDLGQGDNKVAILGKSMAGGVIKGGDGHNTIDIKSTLVFSTQASTQIFLGNGGNDITIGGDFVTTYGQHKIITGSGDDNLVIKGESGGNTKIDLGDGNNTMLINSIGGGLGLFAVSMGSGDDTLKVTGSITNGSDINLGAGKNRVEVNKIEGNHIISTGSLDIVADAITGGTQTLGSGNSSITSNTVINGNTVNSTGSTTITAKSIDNATYQLGNGTDIITLEGELKGSTLNLHNGENKITATNIKNTDINSGSDVDTITTGNIDGGTIHLGDGSDSITMTSLTGNGYIYLDEGNDSVTYNATGANVPDGKIDGGTGNDTFTFRATADYDAANANGWATQFDLGGNLRGFENIDVADGFVTTIRINKDDLTTNEGQLYIKGDAGKDIVDLGDNNYVSDVANNKPVNLANFSLVGQKVVDGVTYNQYHDSSFTNSDLRDVFIQDGIIII